MGMSKKKNLMLMVPMLHQGGFEKVCVETAKLMQPYYNVTILIFSDKDINYDVTGLEIVNIDVPSQKGKAQKALNVLKRIRKVKRIKRERKIDICYSFGSTANLVNVFSRTKEKVLTGLRCSTDMEEPRQVRLFTRRADLVLSCSREILRELRDTYHYERGRYIYNPLDVTAIEEKAKEEIHDYPFGPTGQVIISVGRSDYIKGFWHLIKAFSVVYTSHPNARLIIVGTGDFSGYRKLAQDLGVTDAVCFTGLRGNPFPYVDQADLYVLSSNHEGFPNALIEGMALGKPVIAADCKTGPREILQSEAQYEDKIIALPEGSIQEPKDCSYGVLVPDMSETMNLVAADVEKADLDLACEILRMLDNREKMQNYGVKAKERALTFAPEQYAKDLYRILEEG